MASLQQDSTDVSVDIADLGNDCALIRTSYDLGELQKDSCAAAIAFEASGSESGGPSFGLGYGTERIGIDLARVFTGLSADAGQAPTHLSLRITF